MAHTWIWAALSTVAVSAATLGAVQPAAAPAGADRAGATSQDVGPMLPADLAAVISRGVLRVALPPDRTSYTVVRGRVLGLELEVLDAFAADLGVALEVVPLPSVKDRYNALADGTVDAAAGRLDVDLRYADGAQWSAALASSPLVLVRPLSPQIDDAFAPTQIPLADPMMAPGTLVSMSDVQDCTVAVASAAGWRGKSADLPGELQPMTLDGTPTTEDLLARVADGEVGLALVRRDLAQLEASRLPLSIGPSVGVTVDSRVAFARSHTGLSTVFGDWLDKNDALISRLNRRYLHNVRDWEQRSSHATAVLETGTLSPYDTLLRDSAEEHGLDWRLLAALAYQESRWNRNARSHAGAVGLMQIMPATARQVGVWNRRDPAQSIGGGARYLAWLDGVWSDELPDDDARLPFILASYNAGLGHVADARRLAAEAGHDADEWDAVAPWLLKLQEPAWSGHPVVEYGYCRGAEPVHYVQAVLERWGHYRAVSPADSGALTHSEDGAK